MVGTITITTTGRPPVTKEAITGCAAAAPALARGGGTDLVVPLGLNGLTVPAGSERPPAASGDDYFFRGVTSHMQSISSRRAS